MDNADIEVDCTYTHKYIVEVGSRIVFGRIGSHK